MKRTLTSIATLAVATVASGGLMVGLAGSASAATPPPWEPDGNSAGAILFFDGTGNPVTGGNINSPISAFAQGTATIRGGDTKATLFGYLPKNGVAPGGWQGEIVAGPSVYPNSAAPAAVSQTLPVVTGNPTSDLTIADLEQDFPNTDVSTDGYAGLYQLRLETTASGLGANPKYDSVDIAVTGTGASDTWSVVFPAPTTPVVTPTTTVLTTTPSSPQLAGTSVTLNAAISPAAAGTVQFEDGTTAIGSPVTVTAGAASINTTSLAVGSHSLHAVFSPSSTSFSGSTGDDTFVVTAPAAPGTTTALSVNPTTAPAFSPVTLTADVSQTSNSTALASGTGTVKFFDNGTTVLGTSNVGAGGVATLVTSNFATGAHSITAQFIPADPTAFATSTSLAVAFTATAPTSAPDPQTVDVSIPSGSLTISSPYNTGNPFNLGTATIDPSGGFFTAQGAFGNASNPNAGVTVTDTRAGDLPWTASATVSDFTDGATPPDVINGENLTFTSVVPAYITANALQSGDVVTNDVGALGGPLYSATDTGSNGLKGGPHAFATAAHGAGSVNIDGLLTLDAPSSTPTGNYTATLTFTIA